MEKNMEEIHGLIKEIKDEALGIFMNCLKQTDHDYNKASTLFEKLINSQNYGALEVTLLKLNKVGDTELPMITIKGGLEHFVLRADANYSPAIMSASFDEASEYFKFHPNEVLNQIKK